MANHVNKQQTLDQAPVRDMHRVAAEYHRHFSISRTTASSFFVPIGILTSITMLTSCKQHDIPTWAASVVIVFILMATLSLNIVFSVWSDICRRLEKYYEILEQQTLQPFIAATMGFRHLFNSLAKGEPVNVTGLTDYKRKYINIQLI